MDELVIGGIYKHYKGDLYKVMDVVQHSETLEELVYYVKLSKGTSWVRPKEMFLQTVEKEGKKMKRFELIQPHPKAQPY